MLAGAWAAMPYDARSFFFRDCASEVLSVALERADDVECLVLEVTGLNRTTINHDGRTIESPHGDQTARHIFVATRYRNKRVIPLRPHDGFDRVGNEVATLKAEAHAFGAHRDPVGYTYRIEAHADHVRGNNALLYIGTEVQQVHVAGVALVPNTADANLRLVHVIGGHPRCIKHRLRSALAFGLGDSAANSIQCGHVKRLNVRLGKKMVPGGVLGTSGE
jgi:hypothetical protein